MRIVSAYFLPTRRVRRDLLRVLRRGGRVQLLLAGKSDVPVSQMAARSLYHCRLKAGVEIHEYQPLILHAKLILCDGVAYAGSSNLDIRSPNLNCELMLRFTDKMAIAEAQEIFERVLKHSPKSNSIRGGKPKPSGSAEKITGRISCWRGLIPSSPCGSSARWKSKLPGRSALIRLSPDRVRRR